MGQPPPLQSPTALALPRVADLTLDPRFRKLVARPPSFTEKSACLRNLLSQTKAETRAGGADHASRGALGCLFPIGYG